MKFILPFLVTLISLSACTQKATQKESSITPVAKWKKGEEKTLLITQRKESTGGAKNEAPLIIKYEARIKVLDANDSGYTVQWNYQLTDDFKREFPEMAFLMKPVYEELRIRFTTRKNGEFKELLNWEEVRDAYNSMMHLPDNLSKEALAAFEKAKEMFGKKEMVEGLYIKEIQLYHSIYGTEFFTKKQTRNVSQQNPMGGAPLEFSAIQQLAELNTKKDFCKFEIKQKVNKEVMINAAKEMFNQMGMNKDTLDKTLKDFTDKFEITDEASYTVVVSSGWILSLHQKKIGSSGDGKQIESFVFEMKKD